MTRMTPLLERNEQFARTYNPAALGIPARQVLIVTCLDHRVDPAIVLGLQRRYRPLSACRKSARSVPVRTLPTPDMTP